MDEAMKKKLMASYQAIVSALNVVVKSGKNIVKNMSQASDLWTSVSQVDQFLTNCINGTQNNQLPGKIVQYVKLYTEIVETGFQAGLFGLQECNVLTNALSNVSQFVLSLANDKSKKDKEAIDSKYKAKVEVKKEENNIEELTTEEVKTEEVKTEEVKTEEV